MDPGYLLRCQMQSVNQRVYQQISNKDTVNPLLSETVHSPLFFRKIVGIKRFAFRAAILRECQKYWSYNPHRSQGGLDNSQSHSANVFRVDDLRSEPRVLHELTQKKMVEDAESDIAICFVDETTKQRFLLKLCERNGN